MGVKKKAVALTYDEGMTAPAVLFKGEGKLAELAVETANISDIPVMEDPILTETLYKLAEKTTIPPDLWEVVAGIYGCVMRLKGNYNEKED